MTSYARFLLTFSCVRLVCKKRLWFTFSVFSLTNGRIFLAALAIASLWLYVYRWRTQPLVLRAGSFELPLSARPTLVLCSVATALLLWLASDWDTLVWIFTVEFIVVAVHMLARIPVDENNYDFEAGFDAPASAAGKLPV